MSSGLDYYADTDSLYIDLSERVSVESREISEGVVLDYDAAGNLVGIDIDNASTCARIPEYASSAYSGIALVFRVSLRYFDDRQINSARHP